MSLMTRASLRLKNRLKTVREVREVLDLFGIGYNIGYCTFVPRRLDHARLYVSWTYFKRVQAKPQTPPGLLSQSLVVIHRPHKRVRSVGVSSWYAFSSKSISPQAPRRSGTDRHCGREARRGKSELCSNQVSQWLTRRAVSAALIAVLAILLSAPLGL